MYKELFKRLSDIHKHDKPKGKNSTSKISKQKQFVQETNETDLREPLKEISQELMNGGKTSGKRQSQEQYKTISSSEKIKRLSDKHK